MRFCFLNYSYGALGGVETLIFRMAKWLVKNNHSVCLLTKQLDETNRNMPEGVEVIPLGNVFDQLGNPAKAAAVGEQLDGREVDVVKTFHIHDSYYGSVIASCMRRPVKIIAGIYTPHQLEYLPQTVNAPGRKIHLDNFLCNISGRSRLVCYGDLIKELQDNHGCAQKALYWAPPVREVPETLSLRQPEPGKIVSIGQLVPMKEYNLFMVDVVKSLVSKGRSVSYHIYGGGNMEAKVRQKINDCGLRQCIELHGRLPYEKMEEALRSAALFVGMGTAMIEAAQLGVPSLMACPFDATGKSYGPIFNFPTSADAQQKMLAQPPARSMAEDVERVLSLSKEDYKSECQKTYEHAKYWSLSERMTEFMSIVTVAPWFKKRKWHYILNRFKYGAMYRMRRFRTN